MVPSIWCIALCRDPVIWTGKNEYERVEIWVDAKEQKKKASKTIDIVSYALKVSENGVTCVFVYSPFQVIRHI